jgi:uncharacterized surface protein with fasciclin (FAS1) repeats
MNRSKHLALGLGLATTVAALSPVTALANGKSEAAMGAKPSSMSIVDIVVNDGRFDILETAVIKAGLAGALSGGNQYTVFAPTDDAFRSYLNNISEADAIAAINGMDDASLTMLTNTLLFHVTEGRRISTSVLAAPQYQMLNGSTLTQEALGQAGIGETDISASNGVIHVINSVL